MSRIALGLMRIGNMSEKEVENLIEESLKLGIHFFDIADIYGNTHCEELLGNVLERRKDLREQMYIQSKVGIILDPKGYDLSYDYIINAVKASVKRLKCGYLDSLLLHRVDIFMDNEEIANAIEYLQENKLVKDFGVSNFSESEIEYLKQTLKTPILYNQVQLGIGNTNMLDQTMYVNVPNKLVSKESDSLYFYLKKEKIVIQCWSPYQMGFFEGAIFDEKKYPSLNEILQKYADKYSTSKCAIATAFLLCLNKDIMVINGSTSIKHIKESLDGEKINLTKQDWYKIYHEIGNMLP